MTLTMTGNIFVNFSTLIFMYSSFTYAFKHTMPQLNSVHNLCDIKKNVLRFVFHPLETSDLIYSELY